jgi:hypothetical protein
MLFLAGAALYLWYLGSPRTWLHDAEGGTGRLSTVAFGAGTVWVGVNFPGGGPDEFAGQGGRRG